MSDDRPDERPRLGILISGRGSNMRAVAEAVADGRLHAQIAVVISNRPGAAGLEIAFVQEPYLALDKVNRRRPPSREFHRFAHRAPLEGRQRLITPRRHLSAHQLRLVVLD